MKTYTLKTVIPATVVATIIIEAENNIEAMKQFDLGNYKIIEEVVTKVCYEDADIDYINEYLIM
jgi:hypothetical protein